MRGTFALVMFCLLPSAYAGLYEEELFEMIEQRKDVETRSSESLDRIKFLAAKADLSAQNGHQETALLLAAASGDAEVARVLLDHKADPEARNLSEQTALLAAVANRHYALAMTLILDWHVDTWARDYEGNSAAALISAALAHLTGSAKDDASLLLEILKAPRVLPQCTVAAPAPSPSLFGSCVNWLTPFRAAGVVAVAVVALAVTRSSADGNQ